jgi:hypothetical protein
MRTFARLLFALFAAASTSAIDAAEMGSRLGTGWASTTYLRQVTLTRTMPQVRQDWTRLVLPLELPDERGSPVRRSRAEAAFYEGTVLPELVRVCLERNITPVIFIRFTDCGALAAEEIPDRDFESIQPDPAGPRTAGRFISPYRFEARLEYVKKRLSRLESQGRVHVILDFMHPFHPIATYSAGTREEMVRRIGFDPIDLPPVHVSALEQALQEGHPKNREAIAEFIVERERAFLSMAGVVVETLQAHSPATFEGASMLLGSQVLRTGIGYSRRALSARIGPRDCYVFVSSAAEFETFRGMGLASLRRELPMPTSIFFVGPDGLAIDPATVPPELRQWFCLVAEP